MAQTRIAFIWTLRYEDPLMASAVEERVRSVVATWLRLYPKVYSQGWETGAALGGILQVGLVITKRDQWACRREARKFAAALAIRAKVTITEVIDPVTSSLPPHQHRGFRRFEAPKYQVVEATNGS